MFGQLSSAQTVDSIIIKDGSWSFMDSYQYEYLITREKDKFTLYQTKSFERYEGKEQSRDKRRKIGKISEETIQELLNALTNVSFGTLEVQNFGIDQDWIDKNKNSQFDFIKDQNEHWTPIQKDYVLKQLSDLKNYEEAIKRTVGREGYYIIAKDGGTNFSIAVFEKGIKTLEVNANENPFGMPWTINERESYNPQIPSIISNILPKNKSFNKSRFNAFEALPKSLANQIYNDECDSEMKKLAALEFADELNELKSDFRILESEEYGYRGRYVGDTPQVFRVTLQNELMPGNMFMQYFVTRQGNTLYSRDSLLADYQDLVNRIKSVNFLMDFISEDTSRTIDLFYFDNKGVNEHVIERFNTNPEEWEKYDKYKTNSKFEHLYCGCNYRLASDYLQNSILFELTDEFGNSSIWFLLPDNTPVLHFFEGNKAYKYTYEDYGTEGVSVQYACMKFDQNGNMIKK